MVGYVNNLRELKSLIAKANGVMLSSKISWGAFLSNECHLPFASKDNDYPTLSISHVVWSQYEYFAVPMKLAYILRSRNAMDATYRF